MVTAQTNHIVDGTSAMSTQEISRDIKLFTDQLTGVQTEINNIVNAIAAGMFHPSMKVKMDELEAKKANLTVKLEEAKLQTYVKKVIVYEGTIDVDLIVTFDGFLR